MTYHYYSKGFSHYDQNPFLVRTAQRFRGEVSSLRPLDHGLVYRGAVVASEKDGWSKTTFHFLKVEGASYP
ncbi:hypothetical protein HanIR_Chr15g0741031 [Helianthus annuus]|nr:hypothetical protein HanIR_Chr15g0741031 [Helianthus annuus]